MSTTSTKLQTDTKTYIVPPHHLVLINDDEHSDVYIAEMLIKLFNFSENRIKAVIETINKEDRAILITASKEYTEFKCTQINTYGPDHRIPESKNSMKSEIEPAV